MYLYKVPNTGEGVKLGYHGQRLVRRNGRIVLKTMFFVTRGVHSGIWPVALQGCLKQVFPAGVTFDIEFLRDQDTIFTVYGLEKVVDPSSFTKMMAKKWGKKFKDWYLASHR